MGNGIILSILIGTLIGSWRQVQVRLRSTAESGKDECVYSWEIKFQDTSNCDKLGQHYVNIRDRDSKVSNLKSQWLSSDLLEAKFYEF